MPTLSEDELQRMLRDNPLLHVQQSLQGLRKGMKAKKDSRILADTVKPTKYKAERTEYNGVFYHSAKEAKFAQELDLLKKAGEVDFWLRQVPFQLTETTYRMDFVTFAVAQGYELGAWDVHFYEVKGFRHPVGELKRKQCQSLYGISIEVV